MTERWLHDLGYTYREIHGLALLEIDHLLTGEHMRRLNPNTFSPSMQDAIERARQRRDEDGGS